MSRKKNHSTLDIDQLIANENIIQSDITEEVEQAMLTYAIKTISDRAIPDVKDGLKPVQRRILYASWINRYLPDRKHVKNAKIIGDTMGDYHPHGDGSIYEALVNMSQLWNYRYPLIDFQGNNGSIDGDSAASMRYTEGKLDKKALSLLSDLDKESVKFKQNYSETTLEPEVLPGLLPNLLLNGASGIATGYTTEIPSHQLGEVIDGIIKVIHDPDCTIRDIMQHIKAPDFPTGSYLLNNDKIIELYETGKSSLTFKAKYKIEQNEESDNSQLVFYELPPNVNKPKLVEQIYNLCIDEKKIPRIVDVRDESEGIEIRIVIELHKTAVPEIIINELYDKTSLQKNNTYTMRALVNQSPKVLTLKEIIECYLEHRKDVIYKRTQYLLTKAKNKLHIQEGLKIIIDNIDEAIVIIKDSETDEHAKQLLMTKFSLSEDQVREVMEIRLRQLTRLNKNDINKFISSLQEEIQQCEVIVSDIQELNNVIISELLKLKTEFNDTRKTELISDKSLEIKSPQDNNEPIVLLLTSKNNVRHLTLKALDDMMRTNNLKERNETFIQAVNCNLGDTFILILKDGTYVKMDFSDLLMGLDPKEIKVNIIGIVVQDSKDKSIVALTKRGIVKKTYLKDFRARSKKITTFLELQQEDEIVGIRIIDNTQNNIITIATKEGLVHRFFEKSFKDTSPGGKGIGGMSLDTNDEIVGFDVSAQEDDPNSKIILFTEHEDETFGMKSMQLEEFRPKGRMAAGIIGVTYNKNSMGKVKGILVVKDDTFVLDKKGSIVKIPYIKLAEYSRANKPETIKDDISVKKFYLE